MIPLLLAGSVIAILLYMALEVVSDWVVGRMLNRD
jgi:hypothetical protein